MFNAYDKIKTSPEYYRQFRCGDSLATSFHCLFDDRFIQAWSHHNYFVYMTEGKEIWHTAHGSYHLEQGHCVFVRKGAVIVEKIASMQCCVIMFFMPDEFICQALQSKTKPVQKASNAFDPIISVDDNAFVQAFFHSMMPYFASDSEPDRAILELKFKELVLTLADNLANSDLRSYFCSLLQEPRALTLRQIMEDNFCFNLKLEEFARLSARSLSGFKRDFEAVYQMSPGKWLLEKRLTHARHLLENLGKTVGEAAFESGFENASHFSRAFRNRFGTSPVVIRQQAAMTV